MSGCGCGSCTSPSASTPDAANPGASSSSTNNAGKSTDSGATSPSAGTPDAGSQGAGSPPMNDAGTPLDGGGATPCTCPPVEIQINNTPTANDDLVGLKCERPAHRSKVNCQIRATGPGTFRTVVLTNPDGRLRFPEAGDTTRNVTLPSDGSWVPFQISGELGSNAIGDAVIEAHCQTATGDLKGSKPVTVFWFDQVQMNITAGGAYSVVGGRFKPVGGNAVDYSAHAKIRPAGVDCTAPQVADLRVGIVQNALTATHSRTWGSPVITWNAGVVARTAAVVPSTRSMVRTLPSAANDSEASVAPLYDQPGKSGTLDPLDTLASPISLKPPLGCNGGGAAKSNDSVSLPITPTFGPFDAKTAAGAVVGSVTYNTFVSASFNDSFRTLAVIFNVSSNELCALRERTWALNIDSSSPGPLKASPAAADAAVGSDPITTGTFGNTLINDPANLTTPGAGSTTINK